MNIIPEQFTVVKVQQSYRLGLASLCRVAYQDKDILNLINRILLKTYVALHIDILLFRTKFLNLVYCIITSKTDYSEVES
jgi:hypothetical protein